MSVGDRLSEVRLLRFDSLGDERGQLIALEEFKNVPFDIKRVYYMFDTAPSAKRGFHAHIALEQVAVCLSGSCVIDTESTSQKESFLLDSADKGLYLGGLVWREIRDFSPGCVLAVLASESYREDDYIRNYDDFIDLCQETRV